MIFRIVGGSFMMIGLALFSGILYPDPAALQWPFNHAAKYGTVLLQKLVMPFCNETEDCDALLNDLEKNLTVAIATCLQHGVDWAKGLIPDWPTKEERAAEKKQAERQLGFALNHTRDKEELQKMKEAAAEGEAMIAKINFDRYDETNLCNVKKGISTSQYDGVVEKIAKLVNMPLKLQDMIKQAKDYGEGETLALNKLSFRPDNGNMVFGKMVVLKRNGMIDMAYTLHGLDYQIGKEQPTEEAQKNATKLESYANDLEKNPQTVERSVKMPNINLAHRNAFEAYFHDQAIKAFNSHCMGKAEDVFKDREDVRHAFEHP